VTGLVLASGSPRRRALLRRLGRPFRVVVPDVDERALPGEDPARHVRRLALAKARAVARRVPAGLVLGADTVVALDGRILGKPRDARDAVLMLSLLSGRTHEVLTGVALVAGGARRGPTAVVRTRVTMRPLRAGEIRDYVAGGEPLDKAGAYAIQGGARRFVERVEGSRTNVVGLPLERLEGMLAAWDAPVRPRGRRDP
jgi:septum formation protein